MAISTLTVKPDASSVIAAARIIAKHLSALADELETLRQPDQEQEATDAEG